MTAVVDRDIKPGNGPKPTLEELADLRKSLEFDATRVGAPGSPVRNRAETGLWLITFFEGLLRANKTPGNLLYGVLDGDPVDGQRLTDPSEILPQDRSSALARIQDVLWRGDHGQVDPEKEWSSDTAQEISQILDSYGLGPHTEKDITDGP